ncbi:MAG: hypothetical protein AB7O68_13485 [Pirellulales bacterium]
MRALLAALTAVCLLLGWWSNNVYRQQRAAATLRSLGIHVGYESAPTVLTFPVPAWFGNRIGTDFFQKVVGVEQVRSNRAAKAREVVPALREFPALTSLRLMLPDLTDSDIQTIGALQELRSLSLVVDQAHQGQNNARLRLADLRGLAKLRSLTISGWSIGREDVVVISRLPKLSELSLIDTDATDDTLAALGDLPQLTSLSIGGRNRITDQGLAHVASLTSLYRLVVDCPQATPVGIEPLLNLHNLESLEIDVRSSSSVEWNRALLARFEEALPNCERRWSMPWWFWRDNDSMPEIAPFDSID